MRDYNIKNNLKIKTLKNYYNNFDNDIKNNFKPSCEFYNKTLEKSYNNTTKHLEKIFQEKCFYPLKRIKKTKIEILHKDDHLAKTRTEQLALPKPRKLEELQQQEAFKNFNEIRKTQTYRLYRKSLLSVYNRFMKAKKQQECPKSKIRHKVPKLLIAEHIKQLAIPKKDFSELLTIANNTKALKAPNQQRLRELSKPRIKKSEPKNKNWILTKAIKNFQPSKRLKELSKPKIYATQNENFFEVQPQALTYRATSRIKKLSQPQKVNNKLVELKLENKFSVSKRALKAKVSERVKELACPKVYSNNHIKANPFEVTKAALKSKATKRIQQLAQAKSLKK